MNLDLLKKLVKLANNNPNENEANSAARRACKLIEEGNFNFTSNGKSERKSNNWIEDYFRNMTQYQEQATQRRREQYEREKARQQEEEIKRAQRRKQEEYPGWWNEETYNFKNRTWDNGRYDDKDKYYNRTAADERLYRDLKCSKCGNTRRTKFVGPEFNFVCGTCAWTTWDEERQK